MPEPYQIILFLLVLWWWCRRKRNDLQEIDKLLCRLGEKLKAPEEFRSEGKHLAQQVFLKLQHESRRFSVAEVRFGGSFGKHTDVIEPDLDLIIILNYLEVTEKMWEEALNDFEQIILLNLHELQIRGEPQRGRRSLNFVFHNGVEVDLLPASNMSPDDVYAELRRNPEKFYEYNTSLVAQQLAFLKSHDSSFVHVMIRLAKFWLKSLNFGDKRFQGGSTIMELIATAAAEEEDEKYETDKSVIRTLSRIMEMVFNIDSTKLAFQKISEHKWTRVPEQILTEWRYHQHLVPHVVGTRQILEKKCFIIESVNPFYDLLWKVDEEVIHKLKKFALKTSSRIEKLKEGRYTTCDPDTNVKTIDILTLFQPQPFNLRFIFPSYLPDDVHVTHGHPYASVNCTMDVRNREVMKTRETRKIVETMKWNLLASINMVSCSHRFYNDEDTYAAVLGAITKLIQNHLNRTLEWRRNMSHDWMDVTLTVPCGNGYAVKLSMSWNKV